MDLDSISNQIYIVAINEAKLQHHEYITPEHFLYATLMFDLGKEVFTESGGDIDGMQKDLQDFFKNNIRNIEDFIPTESFSFVKMFEIAEKQAINSSRNIITLGHILSSMFNLKDSYTSYIMEKNNVSRLSLLKYVSHTANKETLSDGVKEKTINISDTSNSTSSSKDEKFLNKYSQNITRKAKLGKLDPLIGREDILDRTIQTLCRRLKNNPIHVGNPGVGKTSIVEGLAQLIVDGKVPSKLSNSEIFYIDMGTLVAGTKYRGDFEERLLKLLNIIEAKPNPIIYIDEIHTAIGTGNVSGGGIDATSIIKPYLAGGKIKFIGSTTFEEYKKYFEKDRALSRRFQQIDIDEPSIDESIAILKGLKPKYEDFHNVTYSNSVISLICELSSKYLNDKYLPDKAIDVMDEAGASKSISNTSKNRVSVTKKDVEKTISLIAKVPTNTVSSKDISKLKNLDKNLKKVIFGQDDAIKKVTDAIKLSRAGLKEEFKPIASLLFVGPTGVGKTEVARQLSNQLGIKLLRYDMSEYQEKHSVSKLIGSPPGYVGYEEGGLLIEDIQKHPHSVLLLDEIEKAHPDIFNVLLQVMDYGSLSDNSGKTADFKDIIVIMTSNAGARSIGKRVIGFDEKYLDESEINREVEKIFSPEFRNRLDSIITFNGIDEKMAFSITKKAFKELEATLEKKKVILKPTVALMKYISEKGFSEIYGAREILRLINTDIKKLLVESLLFGDLKNGGIATIDIKDGDIILSSKATKK